MPINKNELTKEQIQKAMACESVEELIETGGGWLVLQCWLGG